MSKEEVTTLESIPDHLKILFDVSKSLWDKGLEDYAYEVRAAANCIAEALGVD